MTNAFLTEATTKDAQTWNTAVSHSTSDDKVLDYFYRIGSLRGRKQEEIDADLSAAFAEDPDLTLRLVFYNRMITRKPVGFDETFEVQRGQGNRDEFAKSLKWLENNYPDVLDKNLWAVPVVGSWRDLWYDSAATGFYNYVNTEMVYPLILRGLRQQQHRALIAKYLPKIRSTKQTKSDRHVRMNTWGRGLCKYLDWNERDYRRFKSDPENTAHTYQRLICNKEWDAIDFNLLPGKAMFNMVSRTGKDGKGLLSRHGLEEKFLDWVKTQPIVKFKGFVYELYNAAKSYNRNLIQKYTFDKQFEGLLETAKTNVPSDLLQRGVLCALDTSGSMSGSYGMNENLKVAPIDICASLGIFFSSLLEGSFADHVIMFDDKSSFLKLQGGFCDKADQIQGHATAWGSTNFQSVIDEIVRVRKRKPELPIEDYPGVLLVVSDMQFNPSTNRNFWMVPNPTASEQTNYEAAKQKLATVGLPPMTVIWWQVNGEHVKDVPVKADEEGTVLISGFDPSIVTAILGGEEVIDKDTGEKRKATPQEQMETALSQDVLLRLQV
jgi:hypothetical protein